MRTVSPRKSCNSSIFACGRKVKKESENACTVKGNKSSTGKTYHQYYDFQQTWDIATTELSSFIASSTNKRFGFALFFKIAVASSSLQHKSTGSQTTLTSVNIHFSSRTKMKIALAKSWQKGSNIWYSDKFRSLNSQLDNNWYFHDVIEKLRAKWKTTTFERFTTMHDRVTLSLRIHVFNCCNYEIQTRNPDTGLRKVQMNYLTRLWM